MLLTGQAQDLANQNSRTFWMRCKFSNQDAAIGIPESNKSVPTTSDDIGATIAARFNIRSGSQINRTGNGVQHIGVLREKNEIIIN